jgi:hypothetical protein
MQSPLRPHLASPPAPFRCSRPPGSHGRRRLHVVQPRRRSSASPGATASRSAPALVSPTAHRPGHDPGTRQPAVAEPRDGLSQSLWPRRLVGTRPCGPQQAPSAQHPPPRVNSALSSARARWAASSATAELPLPGARPASSLPPCSGYFFPCEHARG